MPVYTRRKEYEKAVRSWSRCRDTYDGSDAVKDKGDVYLPRLDSHMPRMQDGEHRYQAYKTRALFYNAMARTVDGLAGLILQKPPKIEADDDIVEQLDEFTMNGTSLETFALEITKEVIKTGRVGVLIDMSKADDEVAPDEPPRPYASFYRAEDILSWQTGMYEGEEILLRVVLREDHEEVDDKDEWAIKCEEQYRVLELQDGIYHQSVWRKKNGAYTQISIAGIGGDEAKEQFDVIPMRRGVPLDFIPFLVIGPTSIGMTIAKSPMDDLAIVNLAHYVMMADYKHCLHMIALPTPYIAGATEKRGSGETPLGPGVVLKLEKGSTAGFMEFSGSGVASVRIDLDSMQKMMATLGARLLEDSDGPAETATAISMRHAGEHATVRTVAGNVELGLTIALHWFIWWQGTEATPEDVEAEVELNKDYFAQKMTPTELQALIAAMQAEKMSYETFYAQLVTGQLARPGVTAEDELAQIEKEKPEPLDDPALEGEGGTDVSVAQQDDGTFAVVDSTGAVLSTHPTQEEADAEVIKKKAETPQPGFGKKPPASNRPLFGAKKPPFGKPRFGGK